MRRILAVAVTGIALFAVTACADVPQPEPGSSPTQDTALADKKTTCDEYTKLHTEVQAEATPLVTTLEASQTDPLKAASAYGELTTLLAEYETKTAAIEAKAGDAELKAELKAEVDRTKKVQADLAAAGADPAKIEAVVRTVDKEPGKKILARCKS